MCRERVIVPGRAAVDLSLMLREKSGIAVRMPSSPAVHAPHPPFTG
jgi:hypothetical protein